MFPKKATRCMEYTRMFLLPSVGKDEPLSNIWMVYYVAWIGQSLLFCWNVRIEEMCLALGYVICSWGGGREVMSLILQEFRRGFKSRKGNVHACRATTSKIYANARRKYKNGGWKKEKKLTPAEGNIKTSGGRKKRSWHRQKHDVIRWKGKEQGREL